MQNGITLQSVISVFLGQGLSGSEHIDDGSQFIQFVHRFSKTTEIFTEPFCVLTKVLFHCFMISLNIAFVDKYLLPCFFAHAISFNILASSSGVKPFSVTISKGIPFFSMIRTRLIFIAVDRSMPSLFRISIAVRFIFSSVLTWIVVMVSIYMGVIMMSIHCHYKWLTSRSKEDMTYGCAT